MTKIDTSNQALFQPSLYLSIRSEVQQRNPVALKTLMRAVSHPSDLPLLLTAIRGACQAFNTALGLIENPNPEALQIAGELSALLEIAESAYTKYGVADVISSHHRRWAEFQGWKALVEAGAENSNNVVSPALAALGVNLALALAEKKEMANAYCKSIRKDLYNIDIQVDGLLIRPAGDPICLWHSQFYKFWIEFQSAFSSEGPPTATELSIHRSTRSRWIGRSAFPSFRHRGAIPDSSCLSRDQMNLALSHDGRGVFTCPSEYRFALWLIGCSGAPIESVHKIPVVYGSQPFDQDDDWSIFVDAKSMVMKRDYAVLAKGAAAAHKASSDESSFIYITHIPPQFAEVFQGKDKLSEVRTLGDIIASLKSIRSEGLVYPSLTEFKPTWARWSRTLGPHSIYEGDDSFLVACQVGDFGLCAKSKIYYSSVSAVEAFEYQDRLYQRLGWGSLLRAPAIALNFGSRAAPSHSKLACLNDQIDRKIDLLRPARRRDLDDVIAFHNCFAAAFSFRLMLRLSLRSAAHIPLYADIFPDEHSVDLIEKSSQGRVGGMAALLTRDFHRDLKAYRAHVSALTRLNSVISDLPELVNWGKQVLEHQSVTLCSAIQPDGTLRSLSSKGALEILQLHELLAPDFGRKWTENAARLAGISTPDIDRLLRHEVKGQESTSSVNEGSELNWSKRIAHRVDFLHGQILKRPLHGLRASA